MNSDAPEDYVPTDEAPLVSNLLPRPGKLVMRGPLHRKLDIAASSERLAGTMVYDDAASTGVLLVYETTFIYPSVRGSGKTTAVYIKTGPFTITTMDLTAKPKPRDYSSIKLGNWCYALTSPSDGGQVMRWDGSATTPTVMAGGPNSGMHLTAHLQRLFVLDLSGNLFWTDTVAGSTPDLNLAASWQDDASGLTNKIVLGTSDYPVGLVSIGRKLVIFFRNSVYVISGDSPSSFSLRQVTDKIGCVDPQSIVAYDDACYFLSADGLYSYDGVDFVNKSINKVRDLQVAAMKSAGVPTPVIDESHTPQLGYARATHVGNGSLLLVIGTQTPETYATTYFSGLFDVRTGAWSKFSSDALSSGATDAAPSMFLSTGSMSYFRGAPLGWDGRDLIYLDEIARPEASADADKGKDVLDATKHIHATYCSRLGRLATPEQMNRVKRIMVDYKFVPDGASAESTSGWYVSAIDGASNTVLAETRVPAQTDPPTQLGRKRAVLDCNAEANDLQVRIEWRGTGTPPALAAAEIYDVTVEFTPAQDRASF